MSTLYYLLAILAGLLAYSQFAHGWAVYGVAFAVVAAWSLWRSVQADEARDERRRRAARQDAIERMQFERLLRDRDRR